MRILNPKAHITKDPYPNGRKSWKVDYKTKDPTALITIEAHTNATNPKEFVATIESHWGIHPPIYNVEFGFSSIEEAFQWAKDQLTKHLTGGKL